MSDSEIAAAIFQVVPIKLVGVFLCFPGFQGDAATAAKGLKNENIIIKNAVLCCDRPLVQEMNRQGVFHGLRVYIFYFCFHVGDADMSKLSAIFALG